jgi:hypothetical protein
METNPDYDMKTGRWSAPAGARTFTNTRQFKAVQVHNPKDFPGVAIEAVLPLPDNPPSPNSERVSLAGQVVEWRYVLNTHPYGSHWVPIHCGDFVVYPEDPSTNMLRVQSGEDFMHWHRAEMTEDELDRASWLTEDCDE